MSRDYRLEAYDRHVDNIVRDLRSLADRVEREAKPREGGRGVTGTPRHLTASESVNHALVWGIANLGAYRLIEVAHHADEAEREVTA